MRYVAEVTTTIRYDQAQKIGERVPNAASGVSFRLNASLTAAMCV
jgi:hypothetical protein